MEKLLKKRRSIRKYLPEKLKIEQINQIMKAGLYAPSSKNSKPWEIYVTENKEKINLLSTAKPTGAAFIKDAPLVMAIVANPQKSAVWIEDASIMATIMQLVAEDLGVGSCWIQIRKREHNELLSAQDYVKELLSIDAHKKVLCLISFGYPDEKKQAYTDNDLLTERIIWR
ncbi:MAG: nitroreductase family protein [Clostridiales bacterium]|nr:nitroreductase family protein [Clostridiales bacterium]